MTQFLLKLSYLRCFVMDIFRQGPLEPGKGKAGKPRRGIQFLALAEQIGH